MDRTPRLTGLFPGSLVLTLEDEHLGELLPFALFRHFQSAPSGVLQDVGGVVLAGKCGREVFAAIVVDECQHGFIAVGLCSDYRPVIIVILLAKVAGYATIQLTLPGNDNGLPVKVYAKIHVIVLINEVSAEYGRVSLCAEIMCANECQQGGDESFHAVCIKNGDKVTNINQENTLLE
jgi:hypothetical protein